jgi:hypothetical protein
MEKRVAKSPRDVRRISVAAHSPERPPLSVEEETLISDPTGALLLGSCRDSRPSVTRTLCDGQQHKVGRL